MKNRIAAFIVLTAAALPMNPALIRSADPRPAMRQAGKASPESFAGLKDYGNYIGL